jgi:hypothetical protein
MKLYIWYALLLELQLWINKWSAFNTESTKARKHRVYMPAFVELYNYKKKSSNKKYQEVAMFVIKYTKKYRSLRASVLKKM